MGVSNKTISAYERGRALPPLSVLIRIAEAADIKLENLIGKKNELSLDKDKEEKIKRIEERITNLEQLMVKILKERKIWRKI
ncbi:MAG: helix-turn-helix domain-containing protein [Microgenomates group bacterium]